MFKMKEISRCKLGDYDPEEYLTIFCRGSFVNGNVSGKVKDLLKMCCFDENDEIITRQQVFDLDSVCAASSNAVVTISSNAATTTAWRY